MLWVIECENAEGCKGMGEEGSLPTGSFPKTDPHLFQAASDRGHRGREALGQLYRQYAPAFKRFLVRQLRVPRQEADNLVHSFVLNKIIQGRALERMEFREADRARTYLRTCLKRYFLDWVRVRKPALSLPPDLAALDSEGLDAIDVHMALQAFDDTLARMRSECEAKNRMDVWELFNLRFVKPIRGDSEVPGYEEFVARLGFKSPKEAMNAFVTAQRMFARCWRAVIGEVIGAEGGTEWNSAYLGRLLCQAWRRIKVFDSCVQSDAAAGDGASPQM